MSRKPHPVALTAAMLALRMGRMDQDYTDATASSAAHLASELHRLASACDRQAVAECNGELWEGQRQRAYCSDAAARPNLFAAVKAVDAEILKAAARLDRRVARLNADLAPFRVVATRHGDPRGCTLKLGGEGLGEYGIEARKG